MKALPMLLFVLCAAACSDRGNPGDARVKMPGAPEFRFSGTYTVTASASNRTLNATHMGRTILYEDGALHVDGRLVALPARARVVAFDGSDIYVDGRNITN